MVKAHDFIVAQLDLTIGLMAESFWCLIFSPYEMLEVAKFFGHYKIKWISDSILLFCVTKITTISI